MKRLMMAMIAATMLLGGASAADARYYHDRGYHRHGYHRPYHRPYYHHRAYHRHGARWR